MVEGGKERHTDLGCVICGAEDQLRGTVVARANVGNIGFVFDEDLSRTEVAELQNTSVGIQEQILGLDVSMADSLGVDVGQRPEKLVNVQLNL